MDKLKSQVWDVLSELSGEIVVQLLTDWHGTDLIGEEFAEFLSDEGYGDFDIDEDCDDDNEDDDIEDDYDEEIDDDYEIVKVYNIKWDCDGNERMLDFLPTEIDVKVPSHYIYREDAEEDLFTYLGESITAQEGFCHFSFEYEIIEYDI